MHREHFEAPTRNMGRTLGNAVKLLVFAWMVLFMYGLWENSRPASDWYEPMVSIPDFKVGQDVIVNYQLVVHRKFSARWTVRISSFPDIKYVCSGSGGNSYPAGKYSRNMTLSYYVNPIPPCNFSVGEYQAVAQWDMTDENGRFKVQEIQTRFTVLP